MSDWLIILGAGVLVTGAYLVTSVLVDVAIKAPRSVRARSDLIWAFLAGLAPRRKPW